ncbi:MAG: cell division protein FtsQ/DivIB [Candidatus Cryptobacteroides sp.]
MSKVLKHILAGIGCGLLAACVIASFLAGQESRKPLVCKGVAVTVMDSSQNNFVTKADVRTFIERGYGQVVGMKLDSIDLHRIERIVDGRSAVLKSEAFVTKDGMLNVQVTQRKPIVRFQKSDGGFYADAQGCIFPLQNSYASHVQIIDGNIPLKANSGHKGMIEDPAEKEWFRKMMEVVNFMENDRLWKDKIVQIHVGEDGGLVLIPRDGKERFLFGQPCQSEEKFSKMEKYYSYIAPSKEEGYYRTVDLRFNGQVVCRK